MANKDKSAIQERALLTKLTIGQWSGTTTDRNITQEVADAHGTDTLIGRFHKTLVRSPALDKYRKHANLLRTTNYDLTLPWADGGVRILPVMRYDEYRETMTKLVKEGRAFAKEFIDDYDNCVDRAMKTELKGLAQRHEFPSKEHVAGKFHITITQMPIPAQGGGWPSMLREVEDVLNEGYNDMLTNAIEACELELWERIHRYVDRMHRRLSDPDQSFRRTLVTRLQDLVNDLPKMNLNDNENIQSMLDEIKAKLVGEDWETLRDNQTVRKQVSDDAKDILNKMSAFYSPQQVSK